MASAAGERQADWVLKPGDRWHGFEGLAENHVLVDPIKVTILTPGLSADGTMQQHGIPAAVVTKFLSSRRIEIEKTGLYSFLVLFSMGITKGKWSTLVTELINFKDLYDANAPLSRVLPALVEAHPDAYAKMGLKDLCEQVHQVYREDNLPKAQKDMYTTLPEMAMRPADAYESLVRGRVESVEIDQLMGRTLAVMVVPYPPGIPLIMPGERITAATKSIHDYLLYARDFDQQVPGLRDRYPRPALRARLPTEGAIWSTVSRKGATDDPALSEGAHDPDSRSTSCSRSSRSSTTANPQTKQLLDHIAAENFEVEVSDSFDRDVSEDAAVGAYIALVDGDRLEQARKLARSVRAIGFRTPLWALADSHRISDLAVLGADRRGRRLHLSRPADARLLRQAGRRQPRQVRDEPAAAVLRRTDGLRRARPTSRSTARGTRAASSTGSPRPASSSSSTSARASSATTCATPTSTSATC